MTSDQLNQIAKDFIESGMDFRRFLRDLRAQIAHEAMVKANGNMTKAVEILGGIQRETMSKYLGMRGVAWNEQHNPLKNSNQENQND